jgi:multidrug efflux pump subunit AcrA (membrane-fusion protein)
MDIPRDKKRSPKKYIIGGLGAVALIATTIGLSRLQPAAPGVDRAIVWLGEVRRGELVVQVRGPGTLVPERIRFVSAVTAGRVERKHLLPGDSVQPNDLILEMSNPDVDVQLLQTQRDLAQANANYINLRSGLQTQSLQQEGAVAQIRTQFLQAQRDIKANEELWANELIAETVLQGSRDLAEELETRLEIEESRLRVFTESGAEQVTVEAENIQRLQALVDFQQNRVNSMNVRAPVSGIIRDLPLEEGQWVNPGDQLTTIVEPGRLKAEVRIPETQAQNVLVGQRAFIDTRTDTIMGRVRHIDPGAVGGSVRVEISIEGELPRSARPDLSIDGTIEIERLPDVLVMGRPAIGQARQSIGIFKLVPGTSEAVRTTVGLGVSSVNEVEVVNGLIEGDSVILTDMARWDAFDRVRLRG